MPGGTGARVRAAGLQRVVTEPPALAAPTRRGHAFTRMTGRLAAQGALALPQPPVPQDREGQGLPILAGKLPIMLLGERGTPALLLKITEHDQVKPLSVRGQSSSWPTSLARSRLSINSWHLIEWLIVRELSGEQMASHVLRSPPPVCPNPSSGIYNEQVNPYVPTHSHFDAG